MKTLTSSSEGAEEELVEAEAELRPESCAVPSIGSIPRVFPESKVFQGTSIAWSTLPVFHGLLPESRVFHGPSIVVRSPGLGSKTSLYTSQAITCEEEDLGGRVTGGGGGDGGREGGSNTL